MLVVAYYVVKFQSLWIIEFGTADFIEFLFLEGVATTHDFTEIIFFPIEQCRKSSR